MTDIEATHPENNVFGNVGGVVGDAFEVTRCEDELQAGLTEPGSPVIRRSWRSKMRSRY